LLCGITIGRSARGSLYFIATQQPFLKEFTMTMLSFALPLASAVTCVVLRVYLAVNSIDDGALPEGARG
jgi:hypothetical protein